MTAIEAKAALEAAEEARARALAEADAARQVFEDHPNSKTHSAMEVAAQIARNTAPVVESARAELARIERAEVESRYRDAVERAGHARLFDRTADARARLVALYDEAEKIVAQIEAETKAQSNASREASELARQLGIRSGAPNAVPVTLLRAMTGVVIASHVHESDATFDLGMEPHTWLTIRSEPAAHDPLREEWRAAKALVASAVWLPAPTSDYHKDLVDVYPYHRRFHNRRPERHEIR